MTSVNKLITRPSYSAALPGGEAYVVDDNSQVLKINSTGHTVKVLYDCNSCNSIRGLVLVGSNLYVIQYSGTIIEIQPHVVHNKVYNIPDIGYIINRCSLWSDPAEIQHTDILHLVDYTQDNVFSYNLTSGDKQVHVSGLDGPSSVSYSISAGSVYYIVCEKGNSMINVYNSSWYRVSSFGGEGAGDGDLNSPTAAILSSNETILVSDTGNNRISVFTTKGDFLYHLQMNEIHIESPAALSYFKPFLWIAHTTNKSYGLYRYISKQ